MLTLLLHTTGYTMRAVNAFVIDHQRHEGLSDLASPNRYTSGSVYSCIARARVFGLHRASASGVCGYIRTERYAFAHVLVSPHWGACHLFTSDELLLLHYTPRAFQVPRPMCVLVCSFTLFIFGSALLWSSSSITTI